MHQSAQWLREAERLIEAYLPDQLQLELNPRKTVRQPIARGIDFVGHQIKPWRRITRRRTFNAALARLEQLPAPAVRTHRSEEHTSELQSLMRISYAVFCLKKKKHSSHTRINIRHTNK